jgi:hypothetical protein
MAAAIALLVTGVALAISGLTFNNTAPLSVNNTVATVTGLVTCDPTDGTVNVGVTIFQGKGRQLIIGSGGETQACPVGGGTISWTVLVTASPGQTFQKGPASVLLTASNTLNTSSISEGGTIKLG